MRNLVTILVLGLILVPFAQADKLAVVSKVQGDVQIQKAADLIYSPGVTMGTILEENDMLKVGDESFAVLLLLDDKSQVKLRPNTEIAVNVAEDLMGTRLTVRLDGGQVRTQYDPSSDFEFQIATPTSVASVKGTDWWTITDPNTGDQIIVLEGLVDVMNNLTGMITSAGAGETVNSTVDGTVETVPTEEGDVPQDPEDEYGEGVEEEEAPEEEETEEEETAEPEDVVTTPPPPTTEPEVEEPEEEEAAEEGEGLFGDALAMDAGFGAVTIDGVLYNQIALRPDISVGKLGVGLDLVIYMDPDGNIRDEEWNEFKDVIDKILYVRWGQQGDPLYIRVGTLDNVVLGYGLFMNGYSNMMQYPSVRKTGHHIGAKFGNIGAEFVIADYKEFTTNPDFGFGVAALRGTYSLGKLTIGGTMVLDQNQYLGLKDTDGDGYPDLMDGSPETAYPGEPRKNVDTDGDKVVDFFDPDRDGNGYTDNSQDVTIANNDPNLPDKSDPSSFPTELLAADPFDAHANEHGLTGISADISYPLIGMEKFNLVAYAEGGLYAGKVLLYDEATDEMKLESIEKGIGAVPLGLRSNIFNIITASLEARYTTGNFVFGLWDRNYDLERVAFVNYEGNTGLQPQTRYERLYSTESMMGVFGSLGANILDLVTAQAGYQHMTSDDGEIKGIQGVIGIAPDLIPKVKEANAYILRMNVDDPFDFVSEGTLLGYHATIEIGGGATLTWRFLQSYLDLNGDGSIDKDPEAGEIIAQTSIETGFSF